MELLSKPLQEELDEALKTTPHQLAAIRMLVLAGHSRGEVAEKLGLKPLTLNCYISSLRALYGERTNKTPNVAAHRLSRLVMRTHKVSDELREWLEAFVGEPVPYELPSPAAVAPEPEAVRGEVALEVLDPAALSAPEPKRKWKRDQAALFLWTRQDQRDVSAVAKIPCGFALTSTNDIRAAAKQKPATARRQPLLLVRVYEFESYEQARQAEQNLYMALVRTSGGPVTDWFRLPMSTLDTIANDLGLENVWIDREEVRTKLIRASAEERGWWFRHELEELGEWPESADNGELGAVHSLRDENPRRKSTFTLARASVRSA